MRDPSDSLDGLPERFDYIRDVVMKYTRAGRGDQQKWRTFVDSLSGEQLDEVAAVYREMATRGDAGPLSDWVAVREPVVRERWNAWVDAFGPVARYDAAQRNEVLNGGLPIPPEPEQEPRAGRLFELFDYLQTKQIAPFSSGTVKYSPSPRKLDWSKVPPELNYLVKAAEEHGVLWGDDAWAQQASIIKDRMPDVFRDLKKINERLYNTPGEWQRIDAFLEKYPIDIHPEAARVRSLLILIDHLSGRR